MSRTGKMSPSPLANCGKMLVLASARAAGLIIALFYSPSVYELDRGDIFRGTCSTSYKQELRSPLQWHLGDYDNKSHNLLPINSAYSSRLFPCRLGSFSCCFFVYKLPAYFVKWRRVINHSSFFLGLVESSSDLRIELWLEMCLICFISSCNFYAICTYFVYHEIN